MSRLVVTPKVPLGSYPATPLGANTADFAFTPAGAQFADGFGWTAGGNDLLLVHNGNGAPQTVTLTSVVDDKNRKGDITTYSLGIGEYGIFGPFQRPGWQQADGQIYGAASATDVEMAVIRLP